MFQKTVLLIVAVFTMFVISGCKLIQEYAKSSRKYNSSRTYRRKAYSRQKTPRFRMSRQATKNMLHSFPSGRKPGQSLYYGYSRGSK